jgi:membrane protein
MQWLRRLVRVLYSAGRRFAAEGFSARAAGIAYRVLFSLAPLAIVLVSVFGLVLQNTELKQDVVDRIVSVLPVEAAGHAQVEHQNSNIASPASAARLDNLLLYTWASRRRVGVAGHARVGHAISIIASPATAAGLVSLLVFLWAATGMMGAIRSGLQSAISPDDKRPLVRGKLVDLALVGGATILVLLSIGVGLVSQFVRALVAEVGVGGGTATRAVSIGLVLLLWIATALLLYRFVPAAHLRFSDAVVGAVVTAVLLLGISLAGSLLYSKTTTWSLIYGSLTSVLVFLYSVYLCANVLLFGGVVASEWSQTRSSPT